MTRSLFFFGKCFIATIPLTCTLANEHELFPAHKYLNANNCWHFNIYEQGK